MPPATRGHTDTRHACGAGPPPCEQAQATHTYEERSCRGMPGVGGQASTSCPVPLRLCAFPGSPRRWLPARSHVRHAGCRRGGARATQRPAAVQLAMQLPGIRGRCMLCPDVPGRAEACPQCTAPARPAVRRRHLPARWALIGPLRRGWAGLGWRLGWRLGWAGLGWAGGWAGLEAGLGWRLGWAGGWAGLGWRLGEASREATARARLPAPHTGRFVDYFPGSAAALIRGRQFPVQVRTRVGTKTM